MTGLAAIVFTPLIIELVGMMNGFIMLLTLAISFGILLICREL